MINQIWNPSETILISVKQSFLFIIPLTILIIAASVATGLNSLFFPVILCFLSIRGIIIVRGVFVLPTEVIISIFNYGNPTSRISNTYLIFFLLFLPIISTVTLLFTPNGFYLLFTITALIAVGLLASASFSRCKYALLSAFYIVTSLVISWLQDSSEGVMICIILILLLYPESYSKHLILGKIEKNRDTLIFPQKNGHLG